MPPFPPPSPTFLVNDTNTAPLSPPLHAHRPQ